MRAESSVEVAAPADALLGVVTDFEAYPDFLPDIRSARVRSHGAAWWEVTFGLELVRRLDYTLRLERSRDPDGVHRVDWQLVEGFFRVNEGGWRIQPLGEHRCLAHYAVRVQVGVYVPAPILNSLVRDALPDTLDRFRSRAEAVARAGNAPHGG